MIDNDESPARYFIGWFTIGYFRPRIANSLLSAAEDAPTSDGGSRQDVNSGRLPIDIGIDLRRGDIDLDDAIQRISAGAGDPTFHKGRS